MSLNHAEVLAHIALTSKFLEQIILEQKQDPEEIPHIRNLMAEGVALTLVLMSME